MKHASSVGAEFCRAASVGSIGLEALESRRLLSVSPGVAARPVTVIGPSAGLTAAAATPSFTHLETDAQDPNDTSNTNAARNTAIKIYIQPSDAGGGIDASHLLRNAVQITDLTHNVVWNIGSSTNNITTLLRKVNTSGAGDVLVLVPNGLWQKNTTYKVELNGLFVGGDTNKIKDVNGLVFDSFGDSTTTFHTGTYLPTPTVITSGFDRSTQSSAGSHPYTAVAMGPDHRLYAATTEGYIYRFNLNSDGSLAANPLVIDTVRQNTPGSNGNAGRIITGIAFDPGATKDNPVMWVSHGQHRFGNAPDGSRGDVQMYADNYSGKISRLSGANLDQYQDIVIDIPRSVKDHMNNQLIFKGHAAYFAVAAMNAMGGPNDQVWGGVQENIYSATIMQLRLGPTLTNYLHAHGPIDLKIDNNGTTQSDGVHYNIYNGKNPLRIYADGVRNAYDMVFATNGHLYAAVNGSSAGGNTPSTPANPQDVPSANRIDKDSYKDANGNYLPYVPPAVTGTDNVLQVEEDTLLDVKNGSYYGHPNPARGEYVLDGGNPTAGVDPNEFPAAYPVGTLPDRNYVAPAYDFGENFSPDGILQYQSVGAKNGDLNGYLLVCRYSSGSDIVALKPNADGSIDPNVQQRIPGFADMNSPLDIAEDTQTGNLYVAELTNEVSGGDIQLLKPNTVTAPIAAASRSKISVYVTPGDKRGATQTVTITNTGTAPLVLDRSATKFTGTFRRNFGILNLPATDASIAPGASLTLEVRGVLAQGQSATSHTHLALALNDPTLSSGYLTLNVYATGFQTSVSHAAAPASVFSQGRSIVAVESLVKGKDTLLQ
ncbi:MAG: hypothetical protein ACTHM6_05130 [Tepidisphaeraceae bacterium]